MSRRMQTFESVVILGFFSLFLAGNGDKSYRTEMICQELQAAGKAKFGDMVIALYSQKFPNSSFEEVTCLAKELAKQAERCCQEGSNPDDKPAVNSTQITRDSTEITGTKMHPTPADGDSVLKILGCSVDVTACGEKSPYPKHPGLQRCAALKNAEKRRCLATIPYSTDDLPSLLEPSNEDFCTRYQEDAAGHSARYVYELARRQRTIPAGFILNVTESHVKMLETCCRPTASNACFLNERFKGRKSTTFLRFLNSICDHQVNLKSHKTGLTAYYGSLLQIPFEEAEALADQADAALAKCCLQPHAECIFQQFSSLQQLVCNETTARSASEGLRSCCSRDPLNTLPCVDSLKRRPSPTGNAGPALAPNLCEEGQSQALERYLFQAGSRQVHVSFPVLTTVLDHMKASIRFCCSAADKQACLGSQEGKLGRIMALLSKMDTICSQYFEMELPAFRAKVQQESTAGGAEGVEAWVELGTSCCFRHSSSRHCPTLTEKLMKYEDDTVV